MDIRGLLYKMVRQQNSVRGNGQVRGGGQVRDPQAQREFRERRQRLKKERARDEFEQRRQKTQQELEELSRELEERAKSHKETADRFHERMGPLSEVDPADLRRRESYASRRDRYDERAEAARELAQQARELKERAQEEDIVFDTDKVREQFKEAARAREERIGEIEGQRFSARIDQIRDIQEKAQRDRPDPQERAKEFVRGEIDDPKRLREVGYTQDQISELRDQRRRHQLATDPQVDPQERATEFVRGEIDDPERLREVGYTQEQISELRGQRFRHQLATDPQARRTIREHSRDVLGLDQQQRQPDTEAIDEDRISPTEQRQELREAIDRAGVIRDIETGVQARTREQIRDRIDDPRELRGVRDPEEIRGDRAQAAADITRETGQFAGRVGRGVLGLTPAPIAAAGLERLRGQDERADRIERQSIPLAIGKDIGRFVQDEPISRIRETGERAAREPVQFGRDVAVGTAQFAYERPVRFATEGLLTGAAARGAAEGVARTARGPQTQLDVVTPGTDVRVDPAFDPTGRIRGGRVEEVGELATTPVRQRTLDRARRQAERETRQDFRGTGIGVDPQDPAFQRARDRRAQQLLEERGFTPQVQPFRADAVFGRLPDERIRGVAETRVGEGPRVREQFLGIPGRDGTQIITPERREFQREMRGEVPGARVIEGRGERTRLTPVETGVTVDGRAMQEFRGRGALQARPDIFRMRQLDDRPRAAVRERPEPREAATRAFTPSPLERRTRGEMLAAQFEPAGGTIRGRRAQVMPGRAGPEQLTRRPSPTRTRPRADTRAVDIPMPRVGLRGTVTQRGRTPFTPAGMDMTARGVGQLGMTGVTGTGTGGTGMFQRVRPSPRPDTLPDMRPRMDTRIRMRPRMEQRFRPSPRPDTRQVPRTRPSPRPMTPQPRPRPDTTFRPRPTPRRDRDTQITRRQGYMPVKNGQQLSDRPLSRNEALNVASREAIRRGEEVEVRLQGQTTQRDRPFEYGHRVTITSRNGRFRVRPRKNQQNNRGNNNNRGAALRL